MVKSRSIIATPPGATIKEQLADRGMTQKEFAARMAMSEKHISKLINGEVRLTPDVAMRLEMVLGIPAQFWNNLESIYREKLERARAENEMEEDIKLVKKFPYQEMVKNGWIEPASRTEDRVILLRKFFEVVSLPLISQSGIDRIACRRVSETEKADCALLAWAQRAKIEAREMETQPINIEKLQASISKIRTMTRMDPALFCSQLTEVLSSCGIALVFLPHIGGSFLHGASFYDGDRIVIGMTVRGKDADKFWFSLFHEFGHIVLGHIGQQNGTSEEDESAADEYARDALIPAEAYESFLAKDTFHKAALIDFADSLGIDVGILVGRLQKEGILQYNWYNDLKTKYKIGA